MNDVAEPLAVLRLIGALHAVDARLEATLEPLGLSLAKLGALHQLVEAGAPVSLGALAEKLCCVRSNITQLVDRLESEGLVTRAHDPKDRRSVRAALTAAGRRLHEQGLAALEEADQRMLGRLSSPQKSQLFQLLAAIGPA